eukprot:1384519-Rhodomonas_salina.1
MGRLVLPGLEQKVGRMGASEPTQCRARRERGRGGSGGREAGGGGAVSYTHLRAHETEADL